jgi:hypothetical protein
LAISEKKVPPFLIIQFGRSQRAVGDYEMGGLAFVKRKLGNKGV